MLHNVYFFLTKGTTISIIRIDQAGERHVVPPG